MKIYKFLFNPSVRMGYLCKLGFYDKMPDNKFLKKKFKLELGYELNLDNPKTFSEKLQWLKLNDRKPEYTKMVDKYAVKKYVADKIGKQYIIPTLGVWSNPDDIDFDKLPDKFVLKCTHNSGLGMCICRDKSKLDILKVRTKLRNGLQQNYYLTGREWPYKNVKPRIIAEQYMEDTQTTDLRDYKFFCFNGEPVYCQVISNRTTNETIDFFDMEWKHQEFTGLALPSKPFNNSPVPVPVQFEKMKKIAKILAKESAFLRVDFYEVKGNLYFGELTFYPASGFGEFTPDKYNLIIGKMLKLPEKPNKKFMYNIQTGGVTLVDFSQELPEYSIISSLKDYKFFCFNGKVKFLYLSEGLENHDTARISYVTLDWKQAEFYREDYKPFEALPPKPVNFDKMIELAEILSRNIPFLRVDFYEINQKIYFGELTFYSGSGFTKFVPEEWDKKLGELIRLPNK